MYLFIIHHSSFNIQWQLYCRRSKLLLHVLKKALSIEAYDRVDLYFSFSFKGYSSLFNPSSI